MVFAVSLATLIDRAGSRMRRSADDTGTLRTVRAGSVPVIANAFAFLTRSLSGPLAGIRRLASLSA